MNILLQNPAWLALLSLVCVPLLVHLVSRAKPPVHPFSNVEFLRKVIVHRLRFRRPKDWLLLLLRSLAVMAIASAFLLPLLQSNDAPLPGEKRTLILLIDRSASMAAKDGAATRFDAATSQAAAVLSEFKPDLANVVWIDLNPTAIFPEVAPNLAYLQDELSRSSPRPESGSIDRAIELALQQLQQTPGRRELHIFSDFQQSTWSQGTLDFPESIHVRYHACAKSTPPNLSIQSLVSLPSSPVAGQRLTTQCRVVNDSDEPRRVELTLDAAGSRQSQSLSIPANGEAEAAFQIRLTSPGLIPITTEINADAFPMDNQRHAVIRVREALHLAVAAPSDHPTCRTLGRVAAAIPWLELATDADPARPPSCDILCIPDWTGEHAESLAASGNAGSLIIIPSAGCSVDALATVMGSRPARPGTPTRQDQQPGWNALPATDHPAFQLFSGGQFGNPLEGSFNQRVLLPDWPQSTVVARFSDQQAAIIQSTQRPVLLLGMSLDPTKSSWPTEGPFVPAIGELLLHLLPQSRLEAFSAEPGEWLTWSNPDPTNAVDPSLQAPDQSRLPLVANPPAWHCPTPANPGIYRWLVSEQPVQLTAVNFPESESKLAIMSEPPAATGYGSNQRHSSNAALEEGIPLWPWLISSALLLLVIEALAERLLFPRPNPAQAATL